LQIDIQNLTLHIRAVETRNKVDLQKKTKDVIKFKGDEHHQDEE
jgi:hypothetical protein